VKARHWLQFLLHKDTTWQRQFATLRPLLLDRPGIERFVVDVGANDGFYNSNSYPFIARGWRALLIEPHPLVFRKAQHLHRHRAAVTLVNAACSERAGEMNLLLFLDNQDGSHSRLEHSAADDSAAQPRASQSVPVSVVRLEELLEAQSAPECYGLLSIDTEGHDLEVLRGANLQRYRPAVVITENTRRDALKFALLRDHGYRLHAQLKYDSIWTGTPA
jgi:FkbM family methyltransferase